MKITEVLNPKFWGSDIKAMTFNYLFVLVILYIKSKYFTNTNSKTIMFALSHY